MAEKQFKGMIHLLHKRMDSIDYPITRDEILQRIGEEKVRVDFDKELTVREILEPVERQSFSCAAEFYCTLLGSL